MRIDVHCHYYPPAYLAEAFKLGAASSDPWDRGWYDQMHGKAFGNPKMSAVEERIEEMDRAGVDIQALSTVIPNAYFKDAEVSKGFAQMINDSLAEIYHRYPTRFRVFASLPMGHPAMAMDELRRVTGKLGLHGLIIGDNIRGRLLDDPDFLPVFQEADRLGLPIFLHPMSPPGADWFEDYDLVSIVAFMFDNTQAVARLVFGGVMESCPNLKVIVPHLGGAFPYLIGRMDQDHKLRPQCRVKISESPSKYLKKMYVDTLSFHAPAIRCAYETLGPGHMVLGSDHPFALGGMEIITQSVQAMGFPPEEEAAILGGNAAALLGVKV
ncbi:MAG: amidohydrolase family protein [Dehalococcoidia bacterium]|nr:amidohydrolase family protein [Dehalococcoidia bacterium]